MLELGHPWVLALLPVPFLAYWLLPPRREEVSALRVPFFREILVTTDAQARSGAVVLRRGFLKLFGISIFWILIVFALSNPQWVGDPITRTESSRDIMLAIDLSASMDTADFPDESGTNVRRITAVKRVVTNFVANREGDRIGLVVFGDRPYIQLPFTRDLQTAQSLVDLMEVSMAGPRTALGDSIGLAIKNFESSEVAERVLILLTDGNDTASKMTPLNAAGVAKLEGVQIYTIGVGNPEATGEDRVDFETLETIANQTGGRFFTAGDESALADVYQRIDEMAPSDSKTESWRPRDSLVHWPAGAALVLGFFAYGIVLLNTRPKEALA